MLRRVKWPSVLAILIGTGAVVAGALGADEAASVPAGLLAVAMALVARDSS